MSPSIRRRKERPAMKSPDDVMTLTEHLGELRVRIIRSALAITLGAILIIAFYDHVLDFLPTRTSRSASSTPRTSAGSTPTTPTPTHCSSSIRSTAWRPD
jgi:Sec-independent protein secretion pathway component TatC